MKEINDIGINNFNNPIKEVEPRLRKINDSTPVFDQEKFLIDAEGVDELTISKSIIAGLDEELLKELFDCLESRDTEKVKEIVSKNFTMEFSEEGVISAALEFKKERGIENRDIFSFLVREILDEEEIIGGFRDSYAKNKLVKAKNEMIRLRDYQYFTDIVLDVYDDNDFRLRYFEHFLEKIHRITEQYKLKSQAEKRKDEIDIFIKFETESLLMRAYDHYDVLFCKDEKYLISDLQEKSTSQGKDKRYSNFFGHLFVHYLRKVSSLKDIQEKLDSKFMYDENFKGLKKEQLVGIDFMVRDGEKDGSRRILADDMGLGKTLTSIGATLYLGTKRNIVVAPNSLLKNWTKEIGRTNIPKENVLIIEKPEQLNSIDTAQTPGNPDFPMFFLINNEKLSKENFAEVLKSEGGGEGQDRTLIIDEAHNFKSGNEFSKMAETLLSVQARNKFLLTGTPVVNGGKDLYNYFNLVEPENYPMDGSSKRAFSKKANSQEGISGIYHELRKYILRRKLEDYDGVIKEIKENLEEINMEVELEGTAKEIYIAVIEAFRQKFKDAKGKLPHSEYSSTLNLLKKIETDPFLTTDKNESNTIFNYLSREKIIELFGDKTEEEIYKDAYNDVGSNKITKTIDMISELKETGKSVIFVTSPKTARKISETLNSRGIKSTFISGEVQDRDERNNRVENFNDPNSDMNVLVMNQVGEEGLNLQGAKYLFKLDHPWTSAQDRQINARLVRRGQKNKVKIFSFTTKLPAEVIATEKNKKIRAIDSYVKEVIIPRKEKLTEFLINGLIKEKELFELREMADAEKNIMLKLAA